MRATVVPAALVLLGLLFTLPPAPAAAAATIPVAPQNVPPPAADRLEQSVLARLAALERREGALHDGRTELWAALERSEARVAALEATVNVAYENGNGIHDSREAKHEEKEGSCPVDAVQSTRTS